jgi:type VI secretion system protein ImpM
MALGVFGKLPSRRDYVQHGIEPRLLRLIDTWLQRAVAESRQALGEAWLDGYLVAPIWRFWLGAGVAGCPALGALMPSVDGVGRYFPLCALGAFDASVPPPEFDDQDEWFAALEAILLAALSEGGSYELLLAACDRMPPPRFEPAPGEKRSEVRDVFAELRQGCASDAYDQLTCWWVPSPEGTTTPPRAMIRRGMPLPVEYAAMVTLDRQQGLSPALGGA